MSENESYKDKDTFKLIFHKRKKKSNFSIESFPQAMNFLTEKNKRAV